jgi:ABC-2 type transport system ATP-binding protein
MVKDQFLLEACEIGMSFGKNQVLRRANLFVRRGSIVGLVGENGSGKTTFLQIIVGWLKPKRGHVCVAGRLGYCPQETLLFDSLTINEHFIYYAEACGIGGEGAKLKIDSLVDNFRLGKYRKFLASELSGGMKQRLNLALALLNSPDLLVLDEPYAALDWQTYQDAWRITEEIKERNGSVLIVSHFVYDREHFDQIFTLEDGSIRCDLENSK